MSKYTISIENICHALSGIQEDILGFNSVDEIVNNSIAKIFKDDLIVWDKELFFQFERKFLIHNWNREICEETFGLWKVKLNNRLEELLPYYNELYKTATLEYNPLYNIDVHKNRNTTGDRTDKKDNTRTTDMTKATTGDGKLTTSGSDKNVGTSDNTRTDYFSDTPQGNLQPWGFNNNQESYLTTARRVTDNGNTSDTTTYGKVDDNKYNENVKDTGTINDNGKDKRKYKENEWITETGYRGTKTYAENVIEWRKAIINIDMMLIDELKDLFIMLW